MRILIDTSYATRGPSGSAVYIERLVAALREREAVELVEARQRRRLRPGRSGGGLGPLRSAANALLDGLWLHAGLPRAVRLASADVVHHPLPAHSRRIDRPQVSTVQDVAFLYLRESYDPVWRLIAARAYRRAARRSAALVCPTRATADDCVALLGAERRRLVVAPYGPGQAEHEQPVANGPSPAGPLVFVGDAEPRKNLSGLLAAYASYRARAAEPARLVLAGGASVAASGPGVEGAGPTRAELLALLRGARALVHPSLHEGFGFTALEAMVLGVPVLAVRNPGTEEVCGGAALLVGPEELAAGLHRISTDAELRSELSRRGRERAARFSWAEAARMHERAYTLAAGGPPTAPSSEP